jgi:hypothetical protein
LLKLANDGICSVQLSILREEMARTAWSYVDGNSERVATTRRDLKGRNKRLDAWSEILGAKDSVLAWMV